MKRVIRSHLLRSVFYATLAATALSACMSGTESARQQDQYAQDTSPAQREGAIAITCGFSHRAQHDPIRDSSQAPSHMHDFFGARDIEKSAIAVNLLTQSNSCISPADRSSYWVPTMYVDGVEVQPNDMAVYLMAPTVSDVDDVVAPPNGLQMITFKSAWACSRNGVVLPRPEDCGTNVKTRLILEFPHCWDGVNLTYSEDDPHVVAAPWECPPTHPVVLPRMVMEVRYDLASSRNISFSSGDVTSVHGDVIIAWHRDQLQRDIDACVHRGVLCGLTWSTEVGA